MYDDLAVIMVLTFSIDLPFWRTAVIYQSHRYQVNITAEHMMFSIGFVTVMYY